VSTDPDRLLSATLGGAAGRNEWSAEDFDRIDRAALEWEQGRPGPALYANVLASWPTDEPNPSEQVIRQGQEARLRDPKFDRHAQAAVLRSFRAQRTPESGAAVSVPMLGLAGGADPNLKYLLTLKARQPALKLVVIEHGTHGGLRGIRNRPEFVTEIRAFIDSISRLGTR
jgi:hypothetical protein